MLSFEYDTSKNYYKDKNIPEQEKFRGKIWLRKLITNDLLLLYDDRKKIKKILKILFLKTKKNFKERVKEIEC